MPLLSEEPVGQRLRNWRGFRRLQGCEMGLFERYLTVWVGIGMLAGVGLGLLVPGGFRAIAALEVAHVNLVVAVFIWVMIYPMMIQIDWSAVKDVGKSRAACC